MKIITIIAFISAIIATVFFLQKEDKVVDKKIYEAKISEQVSNVFLKGKIKTKEDTIISSKVEGQILFILKDNTKVKKGDLLLEVDTKQLENNLLDNSYKLAKKELQIISKREEVEIFKKNKLLEKEYLKLNLDQDKEHLEEKLSYPLAEDVRMLEIQGELLQQDLANLNDSILLERKSVEKNLSSDVQLLKLLNEKKSLETQLNNNKLELATKLKGVNESEKIEAQLRLKRREEKLKNFDNHLAKLIIEQESAIDALIQEKENLLYSKNKLLKTIKNNKIYAPVDGIFFKKIRFSWRAFKYVFDDVGDEARKYSEIGFIQQSNNFEIISYVHELDLKDIKLNQKVRLKIPALDNKIFTGKISFISNIAKDRKDIYKQEKTSKVALHKMVIEVDDVTDLMANMSCVAEIVFAKKKALFVLKDKVLIKNGKYYLTMQDETKREIKVKDYNELYFEVVDSLKEGDKYL